MDIDKCIKDCKECEESCLKTMQHCLEMGGQHADKSHITLLLDCAKLCNISVDFMIRGSEAHPAICSVCADICEACAEDCESFDDDTMRKCAELCRRCAESCREMETESAEPS